MLRITGCTDQDAAPTLKLEGKLLGPWVAELERACADPGRPSGRLRLDLSAVTFVDKSGVELLHDLLGRGVKLAPCSGLVAELLHVEGR